jgi:hypothetical protein
VLSFFTASVVFWVWVSLTASALLVKVVVLVMRYLGCDFGAEDGNIAPEFLLEEFEGEDVVEGGGWGAR